MLLTNIGEDVILVHRFNNFVTIKQKEYRLAIHRNADGNEDFMTYKKMKIMAYGMTAIITVSTIGMNVQAVKLSDVLPSAGIGVTFSDGVTLAQIQERVLAKAKQDKSMSLSVSEMKAYLKENKAAAPKTITSASIVKTVEVQQVLVEMEAEEKERQAQEAAAKQDAATAKQDAIIAAVADAASNEAVASGNVELTEETVPKSSAEETPSEGMQAAPAVQTEQTAQTEQTVQTEPAAQAEQTKQTEQVAQTEQTKQTEPAAQTEQAKQTEQSVQTPVDTLKSSVTVSGNNEAKTESSDYKDDKSNNKENKLGNKDNKIEGKVIETTQSVAELTAALAAGITDEEKEFSSLVIAKVSSYVNVRSDASEDSEIVGKLYDKSVGKYLSEKNGWYEISSGNVTGYVKAEFCVTGKEAVELAKKVGTRIATVTTTTLKVREEPSTEAAVLGLVPIEEELSVVEEQDGWIKVDIEEGHGWVSMDYVSLRTDFVKAESKAEEEARKSKEAEERRKAQAAASANSQKPESSGGSKNYNSASSYIPAGGGSASGNAVAEFALQFKGNPYVYGGTSLTNGADCSGFVMSVYKNFGVSLPHSSSADRSVGSAVGSLEEAQPGDLICYSGHVALYIGGNQIVHASTAKTGIIVSNASYRKILAIRRIF